MAVATGQRALDAIWEKVEENERLDFEDGLVLMESDDLLQLGELADAARRGRGGTDEVYFVQNLYLNQTNVCRVKCKFCAFAVTQKQGDAYTYHAGRDGRGRGRAARALALHGDPHGRRREPPRRLRLLRGHRPELHEALPDVHLKLFTASEIHHMTKLSGLLARGGARPAQRRWARLASGRRRGSLRRSRPAADRSGQRAPGLLVPHAPNRPRARDPDALHDALRPRRDLRGARRPPASPPRAARRDRRLPRLHPARVPSREHRLRAARLDASRPAPTT